MNPELQVTPLMATMTSDNSPEAQLCAENADLRARLEETEETLRVIRSGEMVPLVVETDEGLFSLDAVETGSNRLRGAILAQVSDAVIAVDPEDRITFFNAAAERLYRAAASDVLGRKVSEIYTRHWSSSEVQAATWSTLRGHGDWRGELVHRLHDGRELHVESSVTMLRGAHGADCGKISAVRDISARKRGQGAAECYRDRAQRQRDAAGYREGHGSRFSQLHHQTYQGQSVHGCAGRGTDICATNIARRRKG